MRTLLLTSVFILISFVSNSQKLEKLWSSITEFQTPESAIYNPEHEIIYVSNIGPKRDLKNGDGFISLLNTDGKIENLFWVKGLNDPKGIAISGNNLYVADIDEVLLISFESGKIEKRYTFPNAKFLNDITASRNGKIFISDMNDHRIYMIEQANIISWKNESALVNVNGLFASNGMLYAGNNSIWEIDINSGEMKEIVTNTGGIDGLIKIDDSTFIYSNWIGKIFISKNGETVQLLDTSKSNINTADISYSKELNILFVPTFSGNTVDAYKIIW
jgi:hypothetical protein